MSWRIVVDVDLCQSHGVCEAEAPEVFEVPKRSKVLVLDAVPSDDRRAAVELAVKYCPTHALRIVDDDQPS
jgi:sterol 14alpha-demethylase